MNDLVDSSKFDGPVSVKDGGSGPEMELVRGQRQELFETFCKSRFEDSLKMCLMVTNMGLKRLRQENLSEKTKLLHPVRACNY